MKALSIIGIIMSIGGLIISLFVMSEAKCHCYCSDDYSYSSGFVPDEAIGGGIIMLLINIFFMVFSIVSAAISFKNKDAKPAVTPVTANPYQNQGYNYQNFQQQQQNPYPPQYTNPYNNPYPSQNPVYPPPPQNPAFPPQTPPYNNPYNPGNNPPPSSPPPPAPPKDPNDNPWAPK